ncbi:ABC transporter ATP-binding protein [Kutzneria kofuensis]
MAMTLAGVAVSTACSVLAPLIGQRVIDRVIVAHLDPLTPYIVLLVLAGVIRFAAAATRQYFGGRLALDVQRELRADVFAATQRLDSARRDEMSSGQLLSRACTDVSLVQGLLDGLPMAAGTVLLFGGYLIVMLWLSPLLTAVALLVGPGLAIAAHLSHRTLFPASWAAQQQAGELAGILGENTAGVRVVRAFGQEERELSRFVAAAKVLFARRLRLVRLNSVFNPFLQSIPALGLVAVLLVGGWLALTGRVSLGVFVAFAAYMTQLVVPVRYLAGVITYGQQVLAGITRVFQVIDARPVVRDRPDAEPLPSPRGRIDFDRVSFGYGSGSVLADVSLRVDEGETIAVVGPSGSGKSTLALLLSRCRDVDSGAVRLDGQDVRDLELDSVRRAVAVVSEDPFLFHDTVRANIAFGRPDADDAEITAAARAAQADEFVQLLPAGYDTVLGEQGMALSGGQRQRIALARALLADPRVLVLDDATSAVDPVVEAEIHAALRERRGRGTTVVIAHRPSTLNLADRICVLDAGAVVDTGTHAELLERCPDYRRLMVDETTDQDFPDPWRQLPVTATARGDRRSLPSVPHQAGGRLESSPESLAATSELLAQVAALPPETDAPAVSDAAAADPGFGLRSLLRPFARGLLLSVALLGLVSVTELALPVIIRYGIDHGVTAHSGGVLTAATVIALLAVAVGAGLSLLETRVTGRTSERILYTLRVKIFAQLQRLGLDFHERQPAGALLTRMTADVDALANFLQNDLLNALVCGATFGGVLIVLFGLDVRLTLALLCVLPVLAVAAVLFRRRAPRLYGQARDEISMVTERIQESLAGLPVIQALRREDSVIAAFTAVNDRYRNTRVRTLRLIATYFPFVELIAEIATAIVLAVGAGAVAAGTLSTGTLVAFLLYVTMFFGPLLQLSQVIDGFQQASVGLRRTAGLLREPTPPAPAHPVPVRRLRGEVCFDNVGFRYQSAERDAVRHLSFRVRAGETVAVVGRTGAGKSTLVKLLTRDYDAVTGAVLVDGVDVRDYDSVAYRRRLGVVPQEPYLFATTVRDNIAYGRPDATDAQIEDAARAVGAHAAISRLPEGYRTEVGEGGRALSAGQRQLIALARAYLIDPDLLVLDEATARLDRASESAYLAATASLAGSRTCVLVAHRLTTAARADRILVMRGGRIVEEGSHSELLAAHGEYAAMWRVFTVRAGAAENVSVSG